MRAAASARGLSLFALILLLLCAPVPGAFADASGGGSGDVAFGGGPLPGEWVAYRDLTWSSPTWIGFTYYGDSAWGAFLKTPSSGSDVRVLFRADSSGGKLILTGQNIVSEITRADVEAVNYLMGLLPEIWGWSVHARSARDLPGTAAGSSPAPGAGSGTVNVDRACAASKAGSRSPLLPAAYPEAKDLPDFGGDVTLLWADEIPVFGLYSIAKADSSPILEMVRTGRSAAAGDDSFFGFSPIPDSAVTAASSSPTPARGNPSKTAGEREIRTVDGISLSLDGNWTMYADNTFFMGNDAVLIVVTADTRSIGLPDGQSADALPLYLYGLFTRSGANAWEVPGSRALTGSSGRFRVENVVYDRETGLLSRNIKICLPVKTGSGTVSAVRIASLSVNDALYRAFPSYFDALIGE